MWLQYALDQDNNLVSVDDVDRCKNNYYCPYCQGELIAKKGKIKVHHFAHKSETCNPVKNQNINLPLFWGFDLVLSRQYLNILRELELRNFQPRYFALPSLQKKENRIFGYLKRKKVLSDRINYQTGLTELGKVILKKPTLLEFCEIQEKLSQEKFIQLREQIFLLLDFIERTIEYKKTRYKHKSIKQQKIVDKNLEDAEEDLKQARIDFMLYHAQYQRVLRNSLYFLEITTDSKTFYKIGVTSRDIETRIQEISVDLSKLFAKFSVCLLGVWSHRGNAEHYFKYRYEDYNFPLGSLTEYFLFEDTQSILADKDALCNKQLNQFERDIINNSCRQLLFSEKVRRGMERAKLLGVHTGRPSVSESTNSFLAKPKNQAIVAVLKKGLSVRECARKTGTAINTVRKVKAALSESSSTNL